MRASVKSIHLDWKICALPLRLASSKAYALPFSTCSIALSLKAGRRSTEPGTCGFAGDFPGVALLNRRPLAHYK